MSDTVSNGPTSVPESSSEPAATTPDADSSGDKTNLVTEDEAKPPTPTPPAAAPATSSDVVVDVETKVSKEIPMTKDQSYTNPAFDIDEEIDIEADSQRWNAILKTILGSEEVHNLMNDCDLHPYGRGNVYENMMEGRRVTVKVDSAKSFIWLMFICAMIGISGAIIFMAEYYSDQYYPARKPSMVIIDAANDTSTTTGAM
ncbi:uncharacterized protein LOC141910051 isoform X2 [Tubulanus polymorphus]|uniref:uncharacterized protein LOC141910051 isoform X2 n=1 Tax=Tubulanus polymorphus TaxID=672921 RepID=UPI003DA53E24